MKILKNIDQLIGNTPLLDLSDICGGRNILGKLESRNVTESTKDRAALQMIKDAELAGKLVKGSTIIEPTSGNTGIALAAIGAAKGYKTIFVMPENMSHERIQLMEAYGAEIVLTPKGKKMSGAIQKAKELESQIPGSLVMNQFGNPSNPKAHELTTAPEIWADTDGTVMAFIAGIGTGGTISGTGRQLKALNKNIKIIGFEPAASPLINKGISGPHGIQGIGADFIPENLDLDIIDKILDIKDEDAYHWMRIMARKKGILVGITSGAAIQAAIEYSDSIEDNTNPIVAHLPDSGIRYMSLPIFYNKGN